MQKKRIALVVNTLSSGGAEHVAANLSKALSDRYDIDLILNDDKNIAYPYEGNIVSLGMPTDQDRMSARYQLITLAKRTAKLHSLKNNRKYAAVISFSDSANLSNVLSGSRFGRTVVSVRYSLDGKEKSEKKRSYLYRISAVISLALANTVVSCSREIGDELKKNYLFNKRKLRVIYNGIDPAVMDHIETALKSADDTDGAHIPQIITVGRLTDQKAQWHILYALKELKNRGIKAKLTILGEGPLRQDLEDLCDKLGIKEDVSMPGWVQDPFSYIPNADVAVFTSTYEGFSNAILEAMAYGIPCISTDHSTGAREIMAPGTDWNNKVSDRIEHAEYGVLIPVSENGLKGRRNEDPDKAEILLADAIQEMLEDRDRSNKYREAGRKRAQELSLESAAAQWAEEAEKLSSRKMLKKRIGRVATAILVKSLEVLPDETYLRWRYFKFFGRMPDLKHPNTYNEKLQWLKLHNRHDEYTVLADKSKSRYMVAEKIGDEHIIPILGSWDKAEDINFDSLPEQFVIKCNHDSGSTFICKDRSAFDFEKAREVLRKSLKTDYYKHGREWPYKNIKPKVIAEPYLKCADGSTPVEYKVLCFDGRAELIGVCRGESRTNERTNDYYDRDFNLLDIKTEYPNSADPAKQKPHSFDKIIEYADCLSHGMPHVRTDFYDVDGKIYFGEMTFFPHGGLFDFDPPKWDGFYGGKIKLPKNVMLIISSFAGGGAERVTVNLANALCEKYNVCLVTLFSNPDDYYPDKRVKVLKYSDYLDNFNKPGMKLVRKLHHGYFPRLMWVRKLKKEFKPTVTISMLIVPNMINALTPCGDFRIVSERADPSIIGGHYLRSIRQSALLADHTVFQSKRVQNMFPRIIRKKSSVILNPVNVKAEATDRKEKRIVTAGRLSDQKNHRLLIRAFGRFHESHRDHILEIYGKGKLKETLEQLAADCGVSDSVRIMEFATDLHERIKNAEMFVLSSDYEGLSNALLEAMMIGLPCISTDCAGSDEVIDDMENGILVPVGDEDALLAAMTRLADDEQLRGRLSENAKRSSERFRTETVIEQWTDLIERNT